MEEFLKKQITGPPFIRFPVKEYIECSKLMKSNNQALRLLQTCMNENSSLWAEVDILRKALYKMKSKWRLEPIFRGTKQVLKCMTTLRSEKLLDTISTALNSVVGLDGKLLVPSRQYLEYLLVKIIGVGKLAVQTIEYCVYVHSRLMGKLEIGHVLSSVISFSAFVSRVWVLSHTLLVQLDTCYHCIYSLHLLATSADYTWLPEFLQLPPKFPVDVEKIVLQSSHREDDSQISMTSPAQEVSHLMSTVEEDVGVVISRSSFKGVMDTVVDRSQPSGVLHRTQFQSFSGSTPDISHAVGDSVLKKKKKKTKKLDKSLHSLKVADIGKVVKRKKVKTKEDSSKRVNKVPMKVSKKGSKLGQLKKSRKDS